MQLLKRIEKKKLLAFVCLIFSILLFNCKKEEEKIIVEDPSIIINNYPFANENAKYYLNGQIDAVSGPTNAIQYSKIHYLYHSAGSNKYIVSIEHIIYSPTQKTELDTIYLIINNQGIQDYDSGFVNPCYILKTNDSLYTKYEVNRKNYNGVHHEIRTLNRKNVYTATSAGMYYCDEIIYTYPNSENKMFYYFTPTKGIVKIIDYNSNYNGMWVLY